MSVHQQQTQKSMTDMSEADAIISQMAEQARDAQAVMGRQRQKAAIRPFFRLPS